jgi:tRNA (guanine-N(7)-)-methyltransferase subunit TRM82
MTRRPCSIALTADNKTILCADKFGDVYELPLIPSPEDEKETSPEAEKPEPQKFKPQASLLTVHSGRNRKVLEEQLKQAEKKQSQARDTPKFKHDLLLGHVSMLTDIVSVTAGSRSYIITADRDEHIRISRGVPQAHIIEGFCLGHNEFVNKLCITKGGRLMSGGGDAYVYHWLWETRQLHDKLPVRDAVLEYYSQNQQLSALLPGNKCSFRIAVSGIWSVPPSVSEVGK